MKMSQKTLPLILAGSLASPLFASELGGYGELHLNYKDTEGTHALPAELDFHRFVLFFGHDFHNSDWSFQAELELEHNSVDPSQTALDDKGGKKKFGYLPLEQAYLNYQPWQAFGIGAGVMLVPAGTLNESHEPPLFFTVERPAYYSRIIPSTWFGNGVSINGKWQGLSYKAVAMEGLDTRGVSAKEGIRGARQKGTYASLASVLTGGRLDWESEFGVALGLSYHRDQLVNNPVGGLRPYDQINISEYHVKYDNYGVVAKFEYGTIDYADYGNLKTGLEQSQGWYGEIGYNVFDLTPLKAQLYPFFHYSMLNTASETIENKGEKDQQLELWKAGLSFKPHSSIALKLDYGINTTYDAKNDKDIKTTEFNAGIGYQF